MSRDPAKSRVPERAPPPPERRSGEGSQSALERMKEQERAKAASKLGKVKRRLLG